MIDREVENYDFPDCRVWQFSTRSRVQRPKIVGAGAQNSCQLVRIRSGLRGKSYKIHVKKEN